MSARESRLYFQLQRTAAVLKQAADDCLLDAASITTAQAAVLNVVALGSAVHQNEIAEILDQKESAVTQMVAKLEERGLLSRERSSRDRRAWEVAITQQGRTATQKAGLAFDSINARLDAVLNGDDQELLVDQLKAIRKALS